jgi:hypothetical protein
VGTSSAPRAFTFLVYALVLPYSRARSSVSPLLSLPPGRLYAPLNLDVLRAHMRTPYTHGDARRTSAPVVYRDNGTFSALPTAVSLAFSAPRLIGLAERTVSSMSLFPSTMSRVFSPCLPYVLPAPPTVHDRCPLSFLLPQSLSILRLLANFPISSSGCMSFQHSNMSISGTWMIPIGSQTTGQLNWHTSWTPVLRPLHPLPSSMAGGGSRFDDVYIRVEGSHYTGRRQVDAPTHTCGMLSHRVFYSVAREAGRCISQPRSDSPAYNTSATANITTSATSQRIHRPTCIRVIIIIIATPVSTITTAILINPTPSSLSSMFVHHGHGVPRSSSTGEHHSGRKDGRFGGDLRSEDVAWTFVMLLCRLVVSPSYRFAISPHTPCLRPSTAISSSDTSGRVTLPQPRGKEVQKGRRKEDGRRRRIEGGGGGGWRRRIRALRGRRARTERAGGGHSQK